MMVKKCVLALVVGLALLPALAWAGPQIGSAAPDFYIPDTTWVNHHLSEWRGKVVHLLFWVST